MLPLRRSTPRRHGGLALVVRAVAAVAVGVVAAGCPARAGTVVGAPIADSDEGRFPHRTHAQIACAECHDPAAVMAGRPARPGADDHAPCDRGLCHQAEFLAAPGKLCAMCHERVSLDQPGGSPLAPYPPRAGGRALASRFSHGQHLDLAAMESAVGFHVSCTDCHASDADGRPRLPGHAVCARCHAPESVPVKAPAMDQCTGCHQPRDPKPSRRRRFIVGDLHFRHGNHTQDRRSERISCADCHPDSATATEVGRHPAPATASCVGCHDDIDRVPSVMRMRVCETCHATVSRRFGILAPRSHLPARERPEDHTLAFRRDHAREARREAPRCASCHTHMSGAARSVCDECHQVMRPADHGATWREFDHGPSAGARADRCATCHTTTFCVSCHARPPRSHFPRQMFRDFGHMRAARFNIRTCVTCHVGDDPLCLDCHIQSAFRNRR